LLAEPSPVAASISLRSGLAARVQESAATLPCFAATVSTCVGEANPPRVSRDEGDVMVAMGRTSQKAQGILRKQHERAVVTVSANSFSSIRSTLNSNTPVGLQNPARPGTLSLCREKHYPELADDGVKPSFFEGSCMASAATQQGGWCPFGSHIQHRP
jgi:hypothetical protein